MKISVLVPYYNEASNILRTVNLITEALTYAQLSVFEILILDDGSNDLDEALTFQLLALSHLKIIRFDHQGKYRLRISGLELATYDQILLCDARVRLHRGSLSFLSKTTGEKQRARNGHVTFDPAAKIWMVFWESMSRIVWPQVFSSSFTQGIINETNFNSWPKGTGLFFAPKDLLLHAMRDTQSLFQNDELSSDDTLVLMEIAQSEGIIYDSSFSADYFPRSRFIDFQKHVFERGTHAVDSFGHKLSAISLMLGTIALIPVLLLAATLFLSSVRHLILWSSLIGVLALFVLAFGVAVVKRLPAKFVASLLMMLPLAAPSYMAGLYRGLCLAFAGKLRGVHHAK